MWRLFNLGGAETIRGGDLFSGPLRKSYRLKRDTFYLDETIRLAIAGRTALSSGSRNPPR